MDPLNLLIGAVLGASCTIGGQLASRRRGDFKVQGRLESEISLVKQTQINAISSLQKMLQDSHSVLEEQIVSAADGLARHEAAIAELKDEGKKFDVFNRQAHSDMRKQADEGSAQLVARIAGVVQECQTLGHRFGEQSVAFKELKEEQARRDEAMGLLATQLQQLESYTVSQLAEVEQARQQLAKPAAEMAQTAGLGDLAALQRAAQAEFARRQRAAAAANFQVPPGGQ